MEKFSVKRPFTVLVAVIVTIILGFVSVTSMSTDLLPRLSLPYMIIVTTYPGASPEKVETSVSQPMESALGTVNHVKNVYSVSAENYSMTQLEFEDGTDMDSAMVKVASQVEQVAATLPEVCGTPNILELSLDMVATMYLSVSRDGYDIYEMSDYVDETVRPYFERQDGVANVKAIGLVDKSVQIELDERKIRDLNDRILAETDEKLAEALAQLDEAKEKVADGQKELEKQEASFGSMVSSALFDRLEGPAGELGSQLRGQIGGLISQLRNLRNSAGSIGGISDSISGAADDFTDAYSEARSDAERVEDAVKDVESIVSDIIEDNLPTEAPQPTETPAEPEPEPEPEPDTPPAGSQTEIVPETYGAGRSVRLSSRRAPADEGEGASRDYQAELNAAIKNLEDALSALDGGSLSSLMAGVTKLAAAGAQVQSILDGIRASDPAGTLDDSLSNAQNALSRAYSAMDQLPALLGGLESAFAGLTQGQLDAAVGFAAAASQLNALQQQLDTASAQYESARTEALKHANLDSLVTARTLSGIIYAQNFSMPAGYIDDKNDNSWLLRVGDEFESSEDIASALLADIDGVGTIRLSDVAEITVIDNADASYTRLNGASSVVLAVFKNSTAGTNEVSRSCAEAIRQLEADNPGTHIVTLMDQGSYITLIVKDILTSMILGALLAILVLAIFLRDIRPTIMVGISIPLSVLFTLVLMYFTGLTLNIMTLSGISLGIGMLVDNSIVVMENIIRLRQRGVPAARASVQGAKQVSTSIVASTLTTVCVFLPMLFTSGTVRELLMPMAMSITFCLTASLVTAMTVIPASASAILRKVRPKKESVFDRFLLRYEKLLAWCLDHKAVPLVLSSALLAVCIARLVLTGIVMLPEITADSIQAIIVTPEEDTKEESHRHVSEAVEVMMQESGLGDVGVMDSAATTGLISSMQVNTDVYGNYIGYVIPEKGASEREIADLVDRLNAATEGLPADVTVTAGGMDDLTSFMATGLSVNVYGQDLERVTEISEQVRDLVSRIDGFENISNGTEDDEPALHLIIDRDEAMKNGLTVAQIYTEIASRLETDVTATTITEDNIELQVSIRDEVDKLTKENLLDMEFEKALPENEMAQSSGSGDLSALAAAFGQEEDSGEEEAEESSTVRLGDFAHLVETTSPSAISRENQKRYMTVSAETKEGYNTTLLSRELQTQLKELNAGLPNGYSAEIGGETVQVRKMVTQMSKMLALALAFVYLVMVAQFQSLLSPFIILFTVPLAFTGGMLGLIAAGEPLSMLSLMGFLVLMGTVVNNGIVFVDYANQLRQGGMERRDALIASGKTRMRPILMTTLTTVLAMMQLIFGSGMGSQLSRGMAIVIAAGLMYATLLTLIIVPVMYDIFYRKPPLLVEIGEDIDDAPDDAAEFMAEMRAKAEREEET